MSELSSATVRAQTTPSTAPSLLIQTTFNILHIEKMKMKMRKKKTRFQSNNYIRENLNIQNQLSIFMRINFGWFIFALNQNTLNPRQYIIFVCRFYRNACATPTHTPTHALCLTLFYNYKQTNHLDIYVVRQN